VKNESIPIFGICFGFHLVAYAYGVHVCRMTIRERPSKVIFIHFEPKDELVPEENIPVNVNHRDYLHPNDINLQDQFDIFSTSNVREYQIVQFIRHKRKPIIASQFHPETHHPGSFHHYIKKPVDGQIIEKMRKTGGEIINNFLWMCNYKKNERKNPEHVEYPKIKLIGKYQSKKTIIISSNRMQGEFNHKEIGISKNLSDKISNWVGMENWYEKNALGPKIVKELKEELKEKYTVYFSDKSET
jgi:GMP synthase-like glutamine amidotransferase/galactitol-specific phosphotransferase system IIB component